MAQNPKHQSTKSTRAGGDSSAIENAQRAAALIEHLNVIMGMTPIRTFLYVATHPGKTQVEIGDALDLAQPSVQVHLVRLGSQAARVKGELIVPLGLLEVRKELGVENIKPFYLTAKGRKLLEDLNP